MPWELWLLITPIVVALAIGAYMFAPVIVSNLIKMVSSEALKAFLKAAAPKPYTEQEKASLRRAEESQGKPGQRRKGKDGPR